MESVTTVLRGRNVSDANLIGKPPNGNTPAARPPDGCHSLFFPLSPPCPAAMVQT